MIKIYLIEDKNKLKYVGSTKQDDIRKRLWGHRYDRRRINCSSKQLDLENCKISILEECEEKERKQKESYWINKIDCVNIQDPMGDKKERDRLRELYVKTWGGNKRYENNLLRIDVNLFTSSS